MFVGQDKLHEMVFDEKLLSCVIISLFYFTVVLAPVSVQLLSSDMKQTSVYVLVFTHIKLLQEVCRTFNWWELMLQCINVQTELDKTEGKWKLQWLYVTNFGWLNRGDGSTCLLLNQLFLTVCSLLMFSTGLVQCVVVKLLCSLVQMMRDVSEVKESLVFLAVGCLCFHMLRFISHPAWARGRNDSTQGFWKPISRAALWSVTLQLQSSPLYFTETNVELEP